MNAPLQGKHVNAPNCKESMDLLCGKEARMLW
jgi:hypothetical protein